LTLPGFAGILPGWARGLPRRLHILKKFCPIVKKRLDNYRNRTYTGARYTKESRRRTTTGAPAPKFSESQAFFRKFWRGMFHVEHPGPNENGSHLAHHRVD